MDRSGFRHFTNPHPLASRQAAISGVRLWMLIGAVAVVSTAGLAAYVIINLAPSNGQVQIANVELNVIYSNGSGPGWLGFVQSGTCLNCPVTLHSSATVWVDVRIQNLDPNASHAISSIWTPRFVSLYILGSNATFPLTIPAVTSVSLALSVTYQGSIPSGSLAPSWNATCRRSGRRDKGGESVSGSYGRKGPLLVAIVVAIVVIGSVSLWTARPTAGPRVVPLAETVNATPILHEPWNQDSAVANLSTSPQGGTDANQSNSSAGGGGSLPGIVHPGYLYCDVENGCGGSGGGPPAILITFYTFLSTGSVCLYNVTTGLCIPHETLYDNQGFVAWTGTTYHLAMTTYNPALESFQQWTSNAGTFYNANSAISAFTTSGAGMLIAALAWEQDSGSNWGGYVSSDSSWGSYTTVSGHFTVPTPTWVPCTYPWPASCTPEVTSVWVGLGGTSGWTSGLWQAGVDVTVMPHVGSGLTYGAHAWYQAFGSGGTNGEVSLANQIPVSFGNIVYVSLWGSGAKCYYYILNQNSSDYVTGSFTYPLPTTSAEWVQEIPCAAGGSSCTLYAIAPSTNPVKFFNPGNQCYVSRRLQDILIPSTGG